MPSVSVIIPAFDAGEFVGSALASVAGQTVPADEVIVVDDGSTDDTAAAAERWGALLPLQVVRLGKNHGGGLGAGAARAAGIERSTRDLIALLDVDDVWLPDHLDVMLAEHGREGGLITANHYLWAPARELGDRPASALVPVPPPDHQRLALLQENFVFVSTLFSRALYDASGGFRNIRCEDWDLWIRMVRAGATVSMPRQVTVLYRQAPHSVSSSDKLLIGDIELLEELLDSAHGDERGAISAALRRRRAKLAFLDGLRLLEEGHRLAARRAWCRALAADASLRRNNSKLNGRVAHRAVACLIAPRTMARVRTRRQQSVAFTVGRSARTGAGT
jgi:GT2 family glycosyltransferase